MDLLQGTKVSGNAVVGVMAPQRGVESVDLFPDDKCRIRCSRSCNDMRLRRKRDFSVRIPILKLPFRFRVQ